MNDGTRIELENEATGKRLNGEYWFPNSEIDYTLRTERRNFALDVGDTTFYVDPRVMSEKSPYFDCLTRNKHFAEGNRGYGHLHEKTDEIACMLKSICPTVYDVYPRFIRALARLAEKYFVKGLQIGCQYSALKANFRKYGNNCLVELLRAAYLYNYEARLRESLIKELLIRSAFLCETVDNEMTKNICNIILKYIVFHKGKGLLWGVCCQCGQQKTANLIAPDGFGLWECDRCEQAYCLDCQKSPCLVEVDKRLRSAFEYYHLEEMLHEMTVHLDS